MNRHVLYSIALALGACAWFAPSAMAANKYVSGNITASTTWFSTNTYFVTSTVTVVSPNTLTVQAGTVVKFASGAVDLVVANGGALVAEGTSGSKITFTASSNAPTAGTWDSIQIQSGASSTISNANIRYGGFSTGTDVYNTGGILTLDTDDIATSVYYDVLQTSGTSTILNSTVHGQPSWYGFDVTGGVMKVLSCTISGNNYGFYSTGNLTLTGNTFSNSGFSGWMSFANGASFNPSGNSSTGNEWHGFYTDGTTYGSQTLPGGDLPYVIAGLTVTSNSTLTLNQGVDVKFYPLKNLIVGNNGTLKVQGTSASSVYFTSFYDNSVYNNTAGSATTAKAGDWDAIYLASGASSTITHAIVRYGGYTGSGNLGSGAAVNNGGGILTMDTDDVATSVFYSVYQTSGTGTILSSTLHGQTNNYGLRLDAGPLTINAGTFYQNNVGIYSSGQLTLTNSSFSDSSYPTDIAYGTNTTFNASGNSSSGSENHGHYMNGTVLATQTLNADLPYLLDGLTIGTSTITFAQGSVAKTFPGKALTVAYGGNLRAQGTSASSVYFTSPYDNVGNNSFNSSTSAKAGDWDAIYVNNGASSTLSYTVARYGGSGVLGILNSPGGTLNISNSEVATSSAAGVYAYGGTVNVSSSAIHHNTEGVEINSGTITLSTSDIRQNSDKGIYGIGGSASISGNAIHANTNYGLYNSSGSLTADNNWWGASVGPGAQEPEEGNFSDATSAGTVAVNTLHNLNGFWAVRNNVMLYNSSTTQFTSQINQAVSDWNSSATGMGIVTVSSTVASTTGVLIINDQPSLSGGINDCGRTSIFPTASNTLDIIQFSKFCMTTSVPAIYTNPSDAATVKLQLVRHELGHALGLGHNWRVSGEVMWPYWTDGGMGTAGFGTSDKNDYNFLWGTFSWVTPIWWPSLLPKF